CKRFELGPTEVFKQGEFTYYCADRMQKAASGSGKKDSDSEMLSHALYAIAIVLLIIASVAGINKYLRNQKDNTRVRESIEMHLVAMRRARYTKARARRMEDYLRQAAAKEKKKQQKKKEGRAKKRGSGE
ncbi:hypothetical protein PENTCL1PPCAC_12155, partial [Pristionchus entomophagus]